MVAGLATLEAQPALFSSQTLRFFSLPLPTFRRTIDGQRKSDIFPQNRLLNKKINEKRPACEIKENFFPCRRLFILRGVTHLGVIASEDTDHKTNKPKRDIPRGYSV